MHQRRQKPRARKPKKKGEKNKTANQKDLKVGDCAESTQPKTARKRKGEPPLQAAKVQGQKNWKQMSWSSIVGLEHILDLALLATLALKQTEKKEVHKHLDKMKNNFLGQCATLKVPSHKQKKLECSTHRLQEETKKSEAVKKTLSSMEENLTAVVSTVERNEQMTCTIEHQCSVLRNRLQEEEAKEIFQGTKETVLNLPTLHPSKDEITLQAQMREAVPDTLADFAARKLGEILQESKPIQEAQELLSLAYKHVDQLTASHLV